MQTMETSEVATEPANIASAQCLLRSIADDLPSRLRESGRTLHDGSRLLLWLPFPLRVGARSDADAWMLNYYDNPELAAPKELMPSGDSGVIRAGAMGEDECRHLDFAQRVLRRFADDLPQMLTEGKRTLHDGSMLICWYLYPIPGGYRTDENGWTLMHYDTHDLKEGKEIARCR